MFKKIYLIYSYFFAIICFIVIIFMILSFVLGGYTVFNTGIGALEVNNPITFISFFLFGIPLPIFTSITLGDIFSGLWTLYIIIFVISLNGPNLSVFEIFKQIKKRNQFLYQENALLTVIVYFSVMLLVFSILEYFQNQVGIPIGNLPQETPIRAFTMISLAPIFEELGFRISLIGGAIFFILFGRGHNLLAIKALWHPSKYLNLFSSIRSNEYKISLYLLIIFSGLFFGAAHFVYGSTWEIGKVPSASIAGILLGWIYFKQGLPSALILHWSFNFLSGSYVYFTCSLNPSIMVCGQTIESNLLVSSFQVFVLITGFLSIGMILLNNKMKKYV